MFNYTETHNLLTALIGNAPFGILTTDLDGYISIVNQQFLDNLDLPHSPQNILETSVLAYFNNTPELNLAVKNCLGSSRKPFDCLNLPLNEKYLHVRGRSFMNGIILTTEDVTDSKEMEALQSMIDGQEEERQRLAREIHDGAGALLSTLSLNLENMRPIIAKEAPAILEQFDTSMKTAKTVNQDLRSISHALMPGTLIDFGLSQAIKSICESAEKAGPFKVDFHERNMEERLPQKIELGLYRIAQELLNNTIKYAKAQHVTVQLIRYPESVLLMIEDDGIGFDKQLIQNDLSEGIGLRNIRVRTKSMGGILSIDTQPGRGVSATIDVALA